MAEISFIIIYITSELMVDQSICPKLEQALQAYHNQSQYPHSKHPSASTNPTHSSCRPCLPILALQAPHLKAADRTKDLPIIFGTKIAQELEQAIANGTLPQEQRPRAMAIIKRVRTKESGKKRCRSKDDLKQILWEVKDIQCVRKLVGDVKLVTGLIGAKQTSFHNKLSSIWKLNVLQDLMLDLQNSDFPSWQQRKYLTEPLPTLKPQQDFDIFIDTVLTSENYGRTKVLDRCQQ